MSWANSNFSHWNDNQSRRWKTLNIKISYIPLKNWPFVASCTFSFGKYWFYMILEMGIPFTIWIFCPNYFLHAWIPIIFLLFLFTNVSFDTWVTIGFFHFYNKEFYSEFISGIIKMVKKTRVYIYIYRELKDHSDIVNRTSFCRLSFREC